jgi:glycopeptide antibiotics resistance protein
MLAIQFLLIVTTCFLGMVLFGFLQYIKVWVKKEWLTRREKIIFCQILYLVGVFVLTQLPLPTNRGTLLAQPMIMIPGHALWRLLQAFRLDPSITIIWREDFRQLVFNMLLFVPAGFFLASFWRLSLKRAIFIGFCCSLVIELLQLSGLLFLYPVPYRYFEVDDLITNTLGTLIGFKGTQFGLRQINVLKKGGSFVGKKKNNHE